MKMWHNYDLAENVYNIIKDNFTEVSKYLPNNIKAVTTTERINMTSTYLSEGLIVYDKTIGDWYKYTSGNWVKYNFGISKDIQIINSSDWNNGTIIIPFATHKIPNPAVKVYYNDGTSMTEVYGCYNINEDIDILLSADIAFNGKVVIV